MCWDGDDDLDRDLSSRVRKGDVCGECMRECLDTGDGVRERTLGHTNGAPGLGGRISDRMYVDCPVHVYQHKQKKKHINYVCIIAK